MERDNANNAGPECNKAQTALVAKAIACMAVRAGLSAAPLKAKLKNNPGAVTASRIRRMGAERGRVEVRRCWRGMKKEDQGDLGDALPFWVSKGKGKVGDDLSPFKIDVEEKTLLPADLEADLLEDHGRTGPYKMELVWQASKVCDGESSAAYAARRRGIYKARVPKRRYVAKGTAIKGMRLLSPPAPLHDYASARSRLYIPAYIWGVSGGSTFGFLQTLVSEGFDLVLFGPDGYPFNPLDEVEVRQRILDLSEPFGHERVLAVMLAHPREAWRKVLNIPEDVPLPAGGLA